MNKFMGGFTVGMIITSCLFLYYKPFQKTIVTASGEIEDSAAVVIRQQIRVANDTTTHRLAVAPVKSGSIKRDSLVLFAKSLIGTPYLYGSSDPLKGFDCSGFITHVFNHFNIKVPRSSYEFKDLGVSQSLKTCQLGDLILFTGTDPLERTIGHMGIVCEVSNGMPSFIHSSSGKANGVTITSMDNKFYQERLMAVIDIL